MATMGLEVIAGTCFQQVNIEIICNVWKPAHLWLALCWNGQTLTLDQQYKVAVTLARRKRECLNKTKKNTLRASMRKHCASGLRAPQAFENGALRHKQLHAGRSDGPVGLLPSQGLPRTERSQR